jgi:hypothetical protein
VEITAILLGLCFLDQPTIDCQLVLKKIAPGIDILFILDRLSLVD